MTAAELHALRQQVAVYRSALKYIAKYPCKDESGPRQWLLDCMTEARVALKFKPTAAITATRGGG